MQYQHHSPLISVVVVTYNSSEFVMETLESAFNQTWDNIELIITDDCSSDDTVEICKTWLDKNKSRFVRTQLILEERNTGVAPNANRGLKASNGEWIKFVAGDDVLMPDCVQELVHFIEANKELPIYFLVHGIIPFRKDSEFAVVFPPEKLMQSEARNQLIYLLKRGNSIGGAAFFLERSTLLKMGGFDENYRLFEDFPLLLKYTSNNLKIWLINKPLLKYRIHSYNLSFDRSFLLKDSSVKFRNEVLFPLMLEHKLYFTYWHRFIQGKRKNRFVWSGLLIISPLAWKIKIYSLMGKSYFYNHKVEFQRKVNVR